MSKDKAKEFIKALGADKKLKEKFSGFTFEELKAAAKELKGKVNLDDKELDSISGGGICDSICDSIF